ncbi:MAG: hypothetical protein IIC04_06755, partial [Proteobacteria bacterium]|nr:hypothetical protein [Pseudomonadota bacterium]
RAASSLGISRKSLWEKMKRYGISKDTNCSASEVSLHD